VQQVSHVGFQRYVIYDYDLVEESNLNRLIPMRATATSPMVCRRDATM
jgi:hypothetical protein